MANSAALLTLSVHPVYWYTGCTEFAKKWENGIYWPSFGILGWNSAFERFWHCEFSSTVLLTLLVHAIYIYRYRGCNEVPKVAKKWHFLGKFQLFWAEIRYLGCFGMTNSAVLVTLPVHPVYWYTGCTIRKSETSQKTMFEWTDGTSLLIWEP